MAKTSVFPHKADLQKGGKWWLGIVDQHYLVGMAEGLIMVSEGNL